MQRTRPWAIVMAALAAAAAGYGTYLLLHRDDAAPLPTRSGDIAPSEAGLREAVTLGTTAGQTESRRQRALPSTGITVSVRDRATGMPIRGAKLWCADAAAPAVDERAVMAITNDEGSAILAPPQLHDAEFLGVHAEGYVPASRALAETPADAAFVLDRGQTLEVVAVDQSGGRIPNLPLIASRCSCVEFQAEAMPSRTYLPSGSKAAVFTASTDAAGVATFFGLPDGRYTVVCADLSRGYLATYEDPVSIRVPATGPREVVFAAVMGRAARVTGDTVLRAELGARVGKINPREWRHMKAILERRLQPKVGDARLFLVPLGNPAKNTRAQLVVCGASSGWHVFPIDLVPLSGIEHDIESVALPGDDDVAVGTVSIDVTDAEGVQVTDLPLKLVRKPPANILDRDWEARPGQKVRLPAGEYTLEVADPLLDIRLDQHDVITIVPGTEHRHSARLDRCFEEYELTVRAGGQRARSIGMVLAGADSETRGVWVDYDPSRPIRVPVGATVYATIQVEGYEIVQETLVGRHPRVRTARDVWLR